MPIFALNNKRYTVTFSASFQIGSPLVLAMTPSNRGWDGTVNVLTSALRGNKLANRFLVIASPTETDLIPQLQTVTNPPLGWPLRVHSAGFFQDFPLEQYLRESEDFVQGTGHLLESEIWICPTGTVLLLGSIHSDSPTISLSALERIVEEHYAELGVIFVTLAQAIVPEIRQNGRTIAGDDEDLCRIEAAIEHWNAHKAPDDSSTRYLETTESRARYEELLQDVYFIEYLPAEKASADIGYVHSTARGDPALAFYINVGFATFSASGWLARHLAARSRQLERQLSASVWHDGVSALLMELKRSRVFCLRFISESEPMNIRLTRLYMNCMAE